MPARPYEMLVLWTRRISAALLAALILALPAVAQSSQAILTKPGSNIAIQATSLYNGVPARGFLPVRVSITNSSNTDGQWEIETQAQVGAAGDSHFGAKAACAVPAQSTRMIEVLAPLPDAGENNYPRVLVHVTGPGVVNPDVSFLPNVQQVPQSALRISVPYAGASSRGTPFRVGTSVSYNTDVATGNTTRTTTTTRADGSSTSEALITHSDGSTQTSTTEVDASGRVTAHGTRTSPPTRGTPAPASLSAALSQAAAATPTSIIRNADGSITQTTTTTRPDGTVLTVKKTTKPDGTSETSYTIKDSSGSLLKGGPGDGSPSPQPTPDPAAKPAPPPAASAPVILPVGGPNAAANFAGALPGVARVPGVTVNVSVPSSAPFANSPSTITTRHADGSTTAVTKTPSKYGTDMVTVETDAAGVSKVSHHEFSLSPEAMELAVPGGGLSNFNSTGTAGSNLGDIDALRKSLAASLPSISMVSLPAISTTGNANTMGQTVSPRSFNQVGAVFAQTAPAAATTSSANIAIVRPPSPPPPPPPPPPPLPSGTTYISSGPTTYTTTGGGTLILGGATTIGRGGVRGTPYRTYNRSPGAPIFVGLSSTLARDQGEKIKNYYLNTCVRPIQQSTLDPAMMSADWRAYLGFDFMFFTAADWLAAPPEVRLALIQWVAAGGELRLIADQDGGLNLPPRINEHYGAGVIEIFPEDELNNYNFGLEHTDPKERALFSLEYHPVSPRDTTDATLGYDVPAGMQAREFTLSSETLQRFTGMDAYATYATAASLPPGYTMANPLLAAENALGDFFVRSGAPNGNGSRIHLSAINRHLVVINTPEALDQISSLLTRYGESVVPAPGVSANASADFAEMKKLQLIIFPSINIDVPTPLDQVAQVLHELSIRYDPERKGVNFHVYPPAGGAPMPRVTLTGLSGMSLADIIRIACANAQPTYSFSQDGSEIALVPLSMAGDFHNRVTSPADLAKTDKAKTETDLPKFAEQMPHLGNRYFVVACVIISFGLLVGPFNLFFFCRGARRPHLLWVTPLLAIIASIAILGFILFAEGIGGRGIYYRITQLNPDGKFAIESEVESSVTGVLVHHDFDLGELAWVMDYDQAQPGAPIWPHGIFLQGGKHYSGDWFASRREQMLVARAVVPSRASLRAEALPGQPPVLHSEHNGLMVNLFYQDGDGHFWKVDRITEGQPTHLLPATPEEYKAAWDENLRSAPSQLAAYLRKVTPLPGTFFALGSGEASPLEPDFTGLRWSRIRHVITGPVL